MALELNKDNFTSEVLEKEGVALIDFWSPRCGPCMMMAPIFDEISKEIGDKAVVAKVNVDAEPELAMKYGIMTIPTFMTFKNGETVDQTIGVTPKPKLIEMVESI